MLYGDIYGIQERLQSEYPDHEIQYVGHGHYNVIEKRKIFKYEGDQSGCPLFSMTETCDQVFSFNHIPDMRVIWHLRDIDVWKHPRGMDGFLDEIEEQDHKTKQKRSERMNDEFSYAARENHRQIMNEWDGMTKSTF